MKNERLFSNMMSSTLLNVNCDFSAYHIGAGGCGQSFFRRVVTAPRLQPPFAQSRVASRSMWAFWLWAHPGDIAQRAGASERAGA